MQGIYAQSSVLSPRLKISHFYKDKVRLEFKLVLSAKLISSAMVLMPYKVSFRAGD